MRNKVFCFCVAKKGKKTEKKKIERTNINEKKKKKEGRKKKTHLKNWEKRKKNKHTRINK